VSGVRVVATPGTIVPVHASTVPQVVTSSSTSTLVADAGTRGHVTAVRAVLARVRRGLLRGSCSRHSSGHSSGSGSRHRRWSTSWCRCRRSRRCRALELSTQQGSCTVRINRASITDGASAAIDATAVHVCLVFIQLPIKAMPESRAHGWYGAGRLPA
jgi:hypothetical protein